MTTYLHLTKEDISTTPLGLNINVTTKGGTVLNFTQEAAEELIKDLTFTLGFIRSGKAHSEWPNIVGEDEYKTFHEQRAAG